MTARSLCNILWHAENANTRIDLYSWFHGHFMHQIDKNNSTNAAKCVVWTHGLKVLPGTCSSHFKFSHFLGYHLSKCINSVYSISVNCVLASIISYNSTRYHQPLCYQLSVTACQTTNLSLRTTAS